MSGAAAAAQAPGGRGPLLMTLAMLAFTLNDAFLKGLSDELPLVQALALRGLMTVVVLGLYAWRAGALARVPAGHDRAWLALRSLGEVGAAFFFVSALFHMPLADVTAILQALPLTVTAAAALVLGERVGPRRWCAVGVGFLGVLLIVRPGGEGFSVHALYALASVLAVTLRDVATRRMSHAVPSPLVALAAAGSVTAVAVLLLPGVETAPVSPAATLKLAGCAVFVVAGYLLMVRVVRSGEVSLTAPFRYTGLVWALVLGLLVFGEWPDALTLLGAGIVVAAGLFTLRRERVTAREAGCEAGCKAGREAGREMAARRGAARAGMRGLRLR